MLDRTVTWWRALGVVLVVLVGLTWPTYAGANTSWHPELLHQGAVLTLHGSEPSAFDVALRTGGHNGDDDSVSLTLYAPLTSRSQLTSIINQSGSPTSSLSTTGSFPLNCRSGGVARFNVSVGEGAGNAQSTCGGAVPYLTLGCSGATCDAVYPLSYTVTNGSASTTLWSLLTITTHAHPLAVNVAWVFITNPARRSLVPETNALRALSKFDTAALTIGANYHGLASATYATTNNAVIYRHALRDVMSPTAHSLLASVPPDSDLAALSRHGLSDDLVSQSNFGTTLATQITNRSPDAPVILNGGTTAGDLTALARIGENDVVLSDTSLTNDPANSLTWGEPFRVTSAAPTVLAVATDTPLANLASDSSLTPGLRSALTLGTLSLLHYQAPFAPAPRTVIIDLPLSHLNPAFARDLFAQMTNDPVATPVTLSNVFSVSLLGANGYPTQATLRHVSSPAWTTQNVSTAAELSNNLSSYTDAVSDPGVTAPLQADVLSAEQRGPAALRQARFAAAQAHFQKILNSFKIDQSTITVTSTGTSLPITITSTAPYTVSGFLILHAPHVVFSPNDIPLSLDSSTKSLRVSTTFTGSHSGDFALTAEFQTPNARLIITQGVIQVHTVQTSVIGYALTGGAMAIIALWWLRTIRRSSKGRHAQ